MRQPLLLQLSRLADERWSRRALRRILRISWLALCIWCVLIGLNLVLGRTPDLALTGVLALLVLGGGLVTLLFERRMPPLEVARRLDRRFRLQEQLSTAVEVSAGQARQGEIADMLLDQSGQTLRQVRRRIAQRRRAPWSDVLALLALMIVALGLFLLAGIGRLPGASEPLPLPPLAGTAGEPPIEEPLNPNEAESQVIPGPGDFAQPGDGQGEASAPGQGEGADGQGQAGAPGAAGQAGQQPGAQSGPQRSASDPTAQRNLDEIADALRDQGVTRPAAEALDRGDLGAAAERLRELADQAGQLSDETRSELSESLRRAANQIQQSNPDLAQQLRESARGLERGDDHAAQGLDQLAQAIEQQGQPSDGQAGQPGQQGQQGQGDQPGEGSMPGDPQSGDAAGDQPGGGGGAGNAAAERRPVQNTGRMGVDGQPVQLDAEGLGQPADGDTNQATAGGVSAIGDVSGGSGGGDGGSGPDPLRIPLDERDVVQDYFTP